MSDNSWSQFLLQTVPNAVHVHHTSHFPDSRCNGEQSRGDVAKSAADRGLSSVVLTPHVGNPDPGMPRKVAENDDLGQALKAYAEGERQTLHGVKLYNGLEDNILADGTLCSPDSVLAKVDYVIASFHGTVPQTSADLEERLRVVGQNPYVDLIGHPQRYMERLDVVDWEKIFTQLAIDGKAVEANFNAWFTYGPIKLTRKGQLAQAEEMEGLQRAFYADMARSGVPVVVSLDVHNAGMWPFNQAEADYMPTVAHLEGYLQMLSDEGITTGQIINSGLDNSVASKAARVAV